jgi:acyl-CoA thioesterase FadM
MEPIDIRVRYGEVRNSSIDTHYEIRKTDSGKLAATGKVTVVLYDWDRRTKRSVDDELRRKIAECSSPGES